jgi:hypothetical protein
MNPNYFADTVQHIARLSKTPGWGAYARDWANHLEADKSGAYKGLVEAVRESLKSSDDQQKSGASEP